MPEQWLYKGIMLSGVPNFALTVGSLIHSYTLRVEMIAKWVCRVLDHMDATGATAVIPTLPKPREAMEARPFTEEFSSGYLLRVIDQFPKTTSEEPWVNQQSYADSLRLFNEPVDDGHLRFHRARTGTKHRLTPLFGQSQTGQIRPHK